VRAVKMAQVLEGLSVCGEGCANESVVLFFFQTNTALLGKVFDTYGYFRGHIFNLSPGTSGLV
jgi:hypothetical protein